MTPTKTEATPAYEVAPVAASTSYSYAEVCASFILWQPTATVKRGVERQARARGRPPDAEPPDAATSGGSPESPSSPATSSGLGDSTILPQNSAAVYPVGYGGHEVVHRATKREMRDARRAKARVRQIGPASWEVESESRPGTFHEVHATPGGLICTCPAPRLCWHIRDKVAPLYAAQQRKQARADRAWVQEFEAPSLLGPERLAVLRAEADYPDEPVWGAL